MHFSIVSIDVENSKTRVKKVYFLFDKLLYFILEI